MNKKEKLYEEIVLCIQDSYDKKISKEKAESLASIFIKNCQRFTEIQLQIEKRKHKNLTEI